MGKNTAVAIILGILFYGLGHIYIGRPKRGMAILLGGMAVIAWNVFTYSEETVLTKSALAGIFWGFQLIDLILRIKTTGNIAVKK